VPSRASRALPEHTASDYPKTFEADDTTDVRSKFL